MTEPGILKPRLSFEVFSRIGNTAPAVPVTPGVPVQPAARAVEPGQDVLFPTAGSARLASLAEGIAPLARMDTRSGALREQLSGMRDLAILNGDRDAVRQIDAMACVLEAGASPRELDGLAREMSGLQKRLLNKSEEKLAELRAAAIKSAAQEQVHRELERARRTLLDLLEQLDARSVQVAGQLGQLRAQGDRAALVDLARLGLTHDTDVSAPGEQAGGKP